MSQHFLLSAQARTLSLMQVCNMSDEDVFVLFRQMRWGKTDGDPVCPKCGCQGHYFIRARKQWRCIQCNHTFSVTSGTWLSSTKLPLRTILVGIAALGNAAKGMSALQLMRHMGVQYKTAYVFYLKLRDVLHQTRHDQPALKGQVEMDGAYINPSRRYPNKVKDRPEKTTVSKRPKQCVIVERMRSSEGVGACRTLTYVIETERAEDITDIAEQDITPGTEIFTDSHSGYSDLMVSFQHTTVNHDVCFMGPNGENTNQAESFFSRFRRLIQGQAHKVGPEYLELYANEAAYREDTRRWDNQRITFDMLTRLLSEEENGRKSRFRGYWNYTRRRRAGASLVLAA